jgi:peptide-methionine (S)-S-oxide reductase
LKEVEVMEVATLGGGCFWCLEAVYLDLDGVTDVRSGYAGGSVENPTYEEVCRGTTGHAEVVRVAFDPALISYREILEVFFGIHDPTTLNRQGADVGTQYRSVIFHHSSDQRETAEAMMRELEAEGVWDDPIVTQLQPAPEFYPAEAYHHDYFRRNPQQAYCQAVIRPKVAKFRARFAHKLRSSREGGGE